MSAPPPTPTLNLSYVDEDGRPHFITFDGLPPNSGFPPPSRPEVPPLAQDVLTPAPTPPIQALHLESYRPPPSLQTPSPRIECININFIQNGVRPHRDRFTGRDRDEEIMATTCRVATTVKVEELIRAMGGHGVMGVTECKLLADGRSWSAVQTFQLGDDNAHRTLAEVGWTAWRGVGGPPVWICPFHPGLEDEEEARYWRRLGFPTS